MEAPVPLYGWILSGLCGWFALSVPIGMSVARWIKRGTARPPAIRFVFLCECRDELCREYVRLTLAEYDSRRSEQGRILYAGHAPLEDEPVSAEREAITGTVDGSGLAAPAPSR